MNEVPGLPDVTHCEVTANGVRLHYVLAGEETADPLVLLHGFPQSWLMWRLVLPALAAKHFVVAVDLRGYGDSEKPPRQSGHDQRTKASDVRALVQHLGLEQMVMIGHDRGARVARRFALSQAREAARQSRLGRRKDTLVHDFVAGCLRPIMGQTSGVIRQGLHGMRVSRSPTRMPVIAGT
jgi:pimeloyl-ACP methyl ester carboxylesterase